jgi:alpha-tubulin suppressor-like RCC1 family protein
VGNGSTSDVLTPACLDVLMDEDITQIVTGTHHTIVLTAEGKIYTWGKNDTGALGHADSHIDMYSLEEYPRLLECPELIDNVAYVAAGSGRSAAVTTDGRLFVWGRNISHIPAAIEGKVFEGLKVTKVALGGEAGKSVIAIITEDGGLWTYGDGGSKMLGMKGATGRHPYPVRMPYFKDKKVIDIYCGPGQHIVAKVLADNE